MNNSLSKAVRFNNTSQGYIDNFANQNMNNQEQNSYRHLRNMYKIQGIQTGQSNNPTPSSSYRNHTSEGNLDRGGNDPYERPMILNDTDMRYENVMQDRNN